MLKPFGVFLLSLFMFTQVHNTAVWVNYELNVEEITELFCINTDKPEMNCHGTCHLKKQIISNEKQNPVESNQLLYIGEIELFSNHQEEQSFENSTQKQIGNVMIHNHYSFLTENSLFHPPRV